MVSEQSLNGASTAKDERSKEILLYLEPLISQLGPDDVIRPSHLDYTTHKDTFSTKQDLNPAVVFAPSQTESLAKIVAFLYRSKLNFHVRGQGFMSASSRDVLISLLKFKSFEYDTINKLATVGTGSTWVEVAKSMRDIDPQYSVTVARTPSVGVGGSILYGGYSWMSSELGFISDPINFIDAEVVKYDGTIVMAADEPDLMWALRGGGGGFGIMTKAVLRAHHYPTDIWSGMILIPRDQLRELARRAAHFMSLPQHPKVNFLIYVMRRALLLTILDEEQMQSVHGDTLAVHVYDACGETHGREAFRWALNLQGAIDLTSVTDTKGVVDMQQNADMLRGRMANFRALPMATATLDEETIVRAIEWHDKIAAIDKDIQSLTMVIIECLVLSPSIGGMSKVALPRPDDAKHYLLVITGCPPDGTKEQDDKVTELILNAPTDILGESREFLILPPGLDNLQDPKKTYRAHWNKLAKLRSTYDPDSRFKALVNP